MNVSPRNASLPAGLAATPMLSRWLSVSPEGYVLLTPGKVELGQGILTALAQIAADELDVDIARVRLRPATTESSPNEGVTSGSLSVQDCGLSIRRVAAQVRSLFVAEAARRLSVDAGELTVADGVLSRGNVSVSYWELANKVSLDRTVEPAILPKAAVERRVAGRSIPRVDIPGRVFATRPYIHDVVFPEMLHGKVLRPPRPGASLVDLDQSRVAKADGIVRLVRDGSFIGVVCDTEANAQAALALLESACRWSEGFELPDSANLAVWLKSQPAEHEIVYSKRAEASVMPVRSAAQSLTQEYLKPYLAHGSIAPSCAIAAWTGAALKVLSHCQGIYNLRADLCLVFDLPEEAVIVEHAEGAGCYGHNGADDVALDAALLARATPSRPVRVCWTRRDELTCSPFGAAMAIKLAADLDDAGNVVDWKHEIWSNGYVARPGRSDAPALLGAFDLAKPFPRYISRDPPLVAGGGSERNSVPIYNFPSQVIRKHRLLTMPLRTSSIRALGAFGNVFAIESFIDELAGEIAEDPLKFRLRHLKDERALAVLDKATSMANWNAPSPEGRGRGLGLAHYKNSGAYCTVVAEVAAETDPRVVKLWIAVDVGEPINPDGVINQIEGGAIQATSWTLKEAVSFDRTDITSGSWESYPILRFSEVPEIAVHLNPLADTAPSGAGEAAQGPSAAAIGNAVFSALGVRVRRLPITREAIIEAMGL